MQFSLSPKRTALQFLEEVRDRHDIADGVIVVAWARLSGAGLLQKTFEERLKNVSALIGVSGGNTSAEAVHVLLQCCRSVHIFDDAAMLIFHPKVYMFADAEENPNRVSCLIGSSNLTGGGLVTNYEAGIELNLAEASKGTNKEFVTSMRSDLDELWKTDFCQPVTSVADIESLVSRGIIKTEVGLRRKESSGEGAGSGSKEGRKKSKKAKLPKFKLPFKLPDYGLYASETETVVHIAPDENSGDNPVSGLNYEGAVFVRTLTGTDINKLNGSQTGTFEPDLTVWARDVAPEFWGWPSQFASVTHRLTREEWSTKISLRRSPSEGSKWAEVNLKQWFRPARETVEVDGELRQHAPEHRLQIGPIGTVRDIAPDGFDKDSLIVFKRTNNANVPFEVFFVLTSAPEYPHYSSIASTQRPQHRFGYSVPASLS